MKLPLLIGRAEAAEWAITNSDLSDLFTPLLHLSQL